ncbi:hypothetical protein SacazDRAFT_02441 [Saccharomonospora azurea NA-128]|uniref:ABC-type transport system involved in multi-copper enzyme maturation, permease component n=1 Tax=Saccharomonospora azurea NA-128 TaxID=882081 RepID=H8G7E9_9PSEU|nr:hypothetical protein SacazDRAFT_02441 [Saccharomonospora azurea NA-128]
MGVTEQVRRPSWPLPWWYPAVPAVAVLVIVLSGTWESLSWPYQEWQYTSAQFHQQTALAAPACAAWAAVVAGRLTSPSRIFAPAAGQRMGAPVVRQHLVPLGAVLVGSYLLGLAPLVAVTVIDAEFGGPDLLVMLSGLLGISASITVGYLIGVLARSAFIAPVAFLLFFAFTVLGSTGDTYAAVVPVLHIDPELGQVENPAMVVFRCVFLLAVTIVAAMVAAQVLAHRVPRPRRGWTTTAALTAIPVALAVLGVSTTPDLFRLPADPPRQCAERHGIEYCVHQGHASQLDDLITALDPAFTARGPQEQIERVHDRALLWSDPLAVPETTHVVILSPGNTITGSEPYFAAGRLAGMDACDKKYPEKVGGNSGGEHPYDRAVDLAAWLERNPLALHDTNPFKDVDTDTMREWITTHSEEIRTCSLDTVELPS